LLHIDTLAGQLLHQFGPCAADRAGRTATGGKLLFVDAPGEQPPDLGAVPPGAIPLSDLEQVRELVNRSEAC